MFKTARCCWQRNLTRRERAPTQREALNAALVRLDRAGTDVHRLLAGGANPRDKSKRLGEQVVTALDGKSVRLVAICFRSIPMAKR
jgi:hypothetical protein